MSHATLPVPTVLVYSRYSCVVLSSAWIKDQLMLGFHSVRILYCRGASPWFQKNLGQDISQDQITSQRSFKHFLGGTRNHRHLQQEAGKEEIQIQFSHCSVRSQAKSLRVRQTHQPNQTKPQLYTQPRPWQPLFLAT